MSRHHLNIALMDFTGNIAEYQNEYSLHYENTTESFDLLVTISENLSTRPEISKKDSQH
jgi:hypothetical protein